MKPRISERKKANPMVAYPTRYMLNESLSLNDLQILLGNLRKGISNTTKSYELFQSYPIYVLEYA